MSSFQDNLRSELENAELNADLNGIIKKENRRRNKIAAVAVSCAVLTIAAGALTVFLMKPLKPKYFQNSPSAVETSFADTTAADEHSFRIVSGAFSKIAEKPQSGADKNGGDVYMIQCFFKCNYYINGVVYDTDDEALNEIFQRHDIKVKKAFELYGDRDFWIEGNNISRVQCTAGNGEFITEEEAEKNNSPQHTVVLEKDELNKSISYVFPEGLDDWIIEENENNLPIDYSKAPTDNVTVSVTFKDGTSQTVRVKLYFNDYGYLVVETEDGTKYNNGKSNDYEQWKNGSVYGENSELISWDFSGRTDEKAPLN